jgi:hypothetical protein
MRESRALKSVDERLASRIAAALILWRPFLCSGYRRFIRAATRNIPCWSARVCCSTELSDWMLTGYHACCRSTAKIIFRTATCINWILSAIIFITFSARQPVLSAPYVALMNASGVSAANPDQTFNEKGEETIQRSLAALLMALLAVVFKTSRMLLPVGWSAVVALGGAFGTQIWSTASRGVWSQTWEALLLELSSGCCSRRKRVNAS